MFDVSKWLVYMSCFAPASNTSANPKGYPCYGAIELRGASHLQGHLATVFLATLVALHFTPVSEWASKS